MWEPHTRGKQGCLRVILSPLIIDSHRGLHFWSKDMIAHSTDQGHALCPAAGHRACVTADFPKHPAVHPEMVRNIPIVYWRWLLNVEGWDIVRFDWNVHHPRMRIPHSSRIAEKIVHLRDGWVISPNLVFEIGLAWQLFRPVIRA